MKKFLKISFLFFLILMAKQVSSQNHENQNPLNTIDFQTFISQVGKNNLSYAAEKFNLDIADAEVLKAKVFPDPEFEIEFTDNGERRMKMGYVVASGINWNLELGGKRKARIDVAQNEREITRLLLEDYFRNLRADATLAYLETIQNRNLLEVKQDSYQQMKKLAEADEIRFKLGSISKVDAQQSNLEAGTLLNEVYEAEAVYEKSLIDLTLLTRTNTNDLLYVPKGSLELAERNFAQNELFQQAIHNRFDLKAALQNKKLSKSLVDLATANRAIDLGLKAGVEYNAIARNEIAPTPAFTAVNVGVTIPLKFSNKNKGELQAAKYNQMQAEINYKQAELAIEAEVYRSLTSYQTAKKQVKQFNTGLLNQSKDILIGKTYSYQRGETSLLEVLDAQRTYNEVQQNYYETLYNCAASLVELERSVGIWDIEL